MAEDALEMEPVSRRGHLMGGRVIEIEPARGGFATSEAQAKGWDLKFGLSEASHVVWKTTNAFWLRRVVRPAPH